MKIGDLKAAVASAFFLLSIPAEAALGPVHCQGYGPDDTRAMTLPQQVEWLSDELAQCDKPPKDRAIDLYNRGIAHTQLGDYAAAIADFGEAIALDPTHAQAYNNRGLAYYQAGDLEAAFLDFTRALEIDPTLFMAYNNRGIIYADRGEYALAIADYDRAIELRPKNAIGYNSRCWALALLRLYQRALPDCMQAVILAPNVSAVYDSRAVVYAGLGRLDEALADFYKAMELAPPMAETYQRFLSEQGFYDGPVDGDFGADSEAALRAWIVAGMPGNETR